MTAPREGPGRISLALGPRYHIVRRVCIPIRKSRLMALIGSQECDRLNSRGGVTG